MPVLPLQSAGEWVRAKLGFDPDATQGRLLDTRSKRVLLNCTRQWGKSTITAAKAVHHAFTQPESLTLVVSPSARQSGEFVRKAAGFARRLGVRVKGDGDNEMSLEFPNGARLVGLPGSEATIRGFSAVSLLLVDEASSGEAGNGHAAAGGAGLQDLAGHDHERPFRGGGKGFLHDAKGGPDCGVTSAAATGRVTNCERH